MKSQRRFSSKVRGISNDSHSSKTSRGGSLQSVWLGYAGALGAVCVLTFLLYWRITRYDFVRFDDANVMELWGMYDAAPFWVSFYTYTVADLFRPLTQTLLILTYRLGSNTSFAYHAASVLYHTFSVALWYATLVTMIGFAHMRQMEAFAHSKESKPYTTLQLVRSALQLGARHTLVVQAALLSLVVAVHPFFASSVAWIGATSELLTPLFLLPALMTFVILWHQASAGAVLVWKQVLLHALLFLLGMLTRETVVLVPLFCLLWVWVQEGDWRWKKYAPAQRSVLLYSAIAWAGTLAVWFLWRAAVMSQAPSALVAAQAGSSVVRPSTAINEVGLTSVVRNIRTIPELLGKVVMPVNLSVYPVYSSFSTILGCLVLVGILSVLVWSIVRQRRQEQRSMLSSAQTASASSSGLDAEPLSRRVWLRLACMGIVWMVVAVLPTLLIRPNPPRYDYFEQRGCLSVIGFVLALAGWLRWVGFGEHQRITRIAAGVVSVSIVVLALLGVRFSERFVNPEQFWSSAVATAPDAAEPYFHYGYELLLQERFAEAEQALQNSLRRDSTQPLNYTKLAMARYGRQREGAFDETKHLFEKALALDPHCDDALLGMVILYLQERRYEEALQSAEQMKRAGLDLAAIRPDVAQAIAKYKQLKAAGVFLQQPKK
jgi:hypothetical protein